MSAAAARDDWQIRRLRDAVTKLVDGSHNPPPKQDQGRPMLSARNVGQGQIVFDDFRYISDTSFEVEHARTRVAPGDVLLTIVGTIGRSAVVPAGIQPFALQRSVAVLSPKEDLLPSFLVYQLQSPRIQRHFEQHARGTAQKGVYLKTLGETPLLVPPLSDQRAIVAEIEKQFSRLDEANDNLKRVGAGLKRYRAAVVESAVDGRLASTEADLARRGKQGYEGGDQLLNRILEERRRKWRGKTKYKEPVPPRVTDLPNLPSGWVWASLDQLSWEAGYGTSVKCSYDEEGPPVLRIPNVENASLDFTDLKFGPASLAISADDAVSAGDMLVIRTNGSRSLIGRAAVVRATPHTQMTFASYLIRFRLLEADALAAWVSTLWQSNRIRSWIESTAATSAGQYNISMTALATAAIPLPPLAEQRRITAEVDRQLSLVRGLESQLYANSLRANHLRESVLSIAFSEKA